MALVAFDNRRQHTLPSVGAVDVAGTKRTSFQVTELVEYEERMITGAFVMTVQTLISCSPNRSRDGSKTMRPRGQSSYS